MEDKSASSSSPVRGTALQRGKACIRCRRRKMKCDSVRPVCTPCIEANRVDDCEYTDNQGRTRTQVLEENFALLESRLQELEGTAGSGQPLFLHDPYSTSTPAVAGHGHCEEPLIGQLSPTPEAPPAPDMWWEYVELPAQISEALISIFLPHSRTMGFVLDPVRFRNELGLPTLHPERPHAALLNVVYLWALRISNSVDLRKHEDVYLQRVILALQNSSGVQYEGQNAAQSRVQAVQAEVLLAQYFFCLGHVLEGRYHANAAVALAVSCGLHRITSSGDNTNAAIGRGPSVFNVSFGLTPARDAVEMAERIRVFWAVFDLDSCWSVALEAPRSLSDDSTRGTQIDTPWSGEPGQLALAPLQPNISGRTVQMFLSGQPVIAGDDSYSVLRAKASALYERAATLTTRINSEVSVENEVQTLARIITQFARGLPPLDQLDAAGDDVRLILAVSHGITHASMIHLHLALPSEAIARATNTFLPHADEILAILELISGVSLENVGEENVRSVVLDPILAVIGSAAGRVFIEELDRTTHGPRTHEARSHYRMLRSSIDRLTRVLHRCAGFADVFPIFSQHASKIEEQLQDDL